MRLSNAEDAKTTGTMNTNDISQAVIEYLRITRTLRTMGKTEPPNGWCYFGMEDFLLRHGRFWTPRTLPSHVPQMTPNYCFDNCYRVATRRKNLRYVEGIASGIIPMHHAWLVDEDDNVIDPTWASTQTDLGDVYFGVTFPVTLVRRIRKTGCVSVFYNPLSSDEIYKQPFTAD